MFREFLESQIHLDANQRIHLSNEENIEFRDTPQRDNFKPEGLWYACGDEWLKYVNSPDGTGLGTYKHAFLLDLDFSQICMLNTKNKLIEFDEQYKDQHAKPFGGFHPIDWRRVALEYAGVELNPYPWSLRRTLMWIAPWSLASGCIWNKKAIKGITKIS